MTSEPIPTGSEIEGLTPREIAKRIVADARRRLVALKPEYDSVDLGEKLISDALLSLRLQVEESAKVIRALNTAVDDFWNANPRDREPEIKRLCEAQIQSLAFLSNHTEAPNER